MPNTEIFHISAECYPIAKVGGLADVVGALPKYQNELGVASKVIMPYYATAYVHKQKFEVVFSAQVALGDHRFPYQVLSPKKPTLGFDLFLVLVEGLMDRERVYSYPDDVERFTAFQIATLDWLSQRETIPDVIHCHDHHTGLVPFMVQYCHKYGALSRVPTVLTIHNAQYQGQFGFDRLHYIPSFEFVHVGLLEWGNVINPLAAAIKCAWRVTTVSPTYLQELMRHANGLEDLLSHEHAKALGILNGVDTEVWNPVTDDLIPQNYDFKTVESGKKACKEQLCKQFGLDSERPLFAFIGRLVWEKGTDLLSDSFLQVLSSLENRGNFLVLGSGEAETEERLRKLHEWFPQRYNAYIGYDEALSHLIYAGADFLLMPSRVEPCGLNQMYSLRYGTIPIVNSVGGLIDTVVDIGEANGFGVRHLNATSAHIVDAIFRAQELFTNKRRFKTVRKKIMGIDHSWHSSVKEYISVYNEIIKLK